MLSIPFVGPWVASLFFGGEFPTPDILSRLFVFHVMLLPGLLIGGIAAHLGLLWLQKHTQYRTPRTREDNVVGLPFWPGQVFRSTGLFFMTAAVVTLVAGLIQINPVWLYGPYVPYVATAPAQPDWYVGWLEGALRLGLPIEPTILGVTIPSPFVPGRADPRAAGHGAGRLAVPRGAPDPRPRRAPPARSAVADADPDRDRGRRRGAVPGAHAGGWQRRPGRP